jgi:hypothetical protein
MKTNFNKILEEINHNNKFMIKITNNIYRIYGILIYKKDSIHKHHKIHCFKIASFLINKLKDKDKIELRILMMMIYKLLLVFLMMIMSKYNNKITMVIELKHQMMFKINKIVKNKSSRQILKRVINHKKEIY